MYTWFCILAAALTCAWPSLGQTPEISSPEVSKATAATPKVELDAKEPWGVALKGGVDSSREYLHKEGGRTSPGSVRAEWGVTLQALQEEMGDLPRFTLVNSPAEKALSCSPEQGTTTCFSNPGAPWYVDFGENFQWAVTPFMTFAPDGRLFRYWATFSRNAFEEIRATLLARLGKPTSDKISTVQNRMGATFDQEILVWKMKHTTVELTKRADHDLTTGILSAEYLPIAKTIPSPPAAKAPM